MAREEAYSIFLCPRELQKEMSSEEISNFEEGFFPFSLFGN